MVRQKLGDIPRWAVTVDIGVHEVGIQVVVLTQPLQCRVRVRFLSSHHAKIFIEEFFCVFVGNAVGINDVGLSEIAGSAHLEQVAVLIKIMFQKWFVDLLDHVENPHVEALG